MDADVLSKVKLGVAALVVVFAAYLAFANGAWWLWVANSAFRGIRAPRDIGLGIQCLIATALPVAAGLAVFFRTRRTSDGCDRPMMMAGVATIALVIPAMIYGALLRGPF